MSRIGGNPIPLPSGANITIEDAAVRVKGPKGELSCPIPQGISFVVEDGNLLCKRESDAYAANHGLARALAGNAVTGVTTGFKKELEIVGVGYRASVAGKVGVFNLGYSHTIEVLMPEGVNITVEGQTKVTIEGADKQQVGQVAAKIRALRPPDPYKQKGVRYVGETLIKKEGKTGA